MEALYYCVKAFSNNLFDGSPAGIILLTAPLEREIMQKISAINGFPETVFLYNQTGKNAYLIWWFTPTCEVFDAGHATLATQHILFNEIHTKKSDQYVTLRWPKGEKCIYRKDHALLKYDTILPLKKISSYSKSINGSTSYNTFSDNQDLVLILNSHVEVEHYQPDLKCISELPYRGLAISSIDMKHHYCCRFFAPKYGVNEDYVTASVHKYLAYFWMKNDCITQISGIQYSPNPGVVYGSLETNGVNLSGHCYTYSKGRIFL